MPDRVRTGTILVEDGIPTPGAMAVATQQYSAGWSSILNFTSPQLGRELEDAGWTFFYMAGELRTSGFGFNKQSRTDRAVAHLIDAVKRQRCNCVEIDQLRQRSLLGLPYVSVVAHARHIQRSREFYGLSSRPVVAALLPRGSLIEQPVPVQSDTSFTGESIQAWENEGGSRAESSSVARHKPTIATLRPLNEI
jgi:hypothetical protein